METINTVLPETTTGEVGGDLLIKARLIAAAATTMAEPTAGEPIALDEAKAHLRVIGDDEDDLITGMIITAREMAEGRLNRTITRRTRTEVFAGWGAALVLLKPPIVSVDSVTYADNLGEVQTLDAGSYFIAPTTDAPAEIELAPGFQAPALHFRRRPIAVTYTAGYPAGEVPRAIRQWMLLAIGTLYDNRETMVNGTISQPLAGDFMQMLIQQYMVYE